MVNPDWINRAKQGDTEAIAYLIQQSLQVDGLEARVQQRGSELQILLASAIPLGKEQIIPRIRQGMTQLAVAQVKQVKLYCKRTDSQFPDWSATLPLQTATPASPTAPSKGTRSHASQSTGAQSNTAQSTGAQSREAQPHTGAPQVTQSFSSVPGSDRGLAVLVHLSALLGYLTWLGGDNVSALFGGGSIWLAGRLGVPLLVWLTRGRESAFVKTHAKEALNFQISMVICWLVVIALFFVLIGFLLAPLLAVFELVCVIVAAAKVGSTVPFRYPLNLRLIK